MHCPALPQAKVITVINLKGGVGKTHTAWLLSSVCQERSLRLLVVDTDTQANLTNSLLPERNEQPGLEALFVTVQSPTWPSSCGAGRPDR
jgi:chromosome partitioning protein